MAIFAIFTTFHDPNRKELGQKIYEEFTSADVIFGDLNLTYVIGDNKTTSLDSILTSNSFQNHVRWSTFYSQLTQQFSKLHQGFEYELECRLDRVDKHRFGDHSLLMLSMAAWEGLKIRQLPTITSNNSTPKSIVFCDYNILTQEKVEASGTKSAASLLLRKLKMYLTV